jgi:hypothetical protein
MSVRAIHLSLFPAHGAIPLVVIGASVVNIWAAHKVGAARRTHNIPYPQVGLAGDGGAGGQFERSLTSRGGDGRRCTRRRATRTPRRSTACSARTRTCWSSCRRSSRSSRPDRTSSVMTADGCLCRSAWLTFVLAVWNRIYRPKVAAAAGFVRIVGFVFFVNGYASGDPKKRMRGVFGTPDNPLSVDRSEVSRD